MFFAYSEKFCLDYNWSVLLVQLIILYFELKNKDEKLNCNFKMDFLLGILAGCTILLKQSTGLLFAFIFIFYKILYISNKENLKEILKTVGMRLLGTLIPVLIFIVYLLISKTLGDFISYGVLGIKTFSNKVNYFTLFKSDNYLVRILAGIMPLQIIIMFIVCIISFRKKELENKEWFKNLSIFLVYSLATAAVIIPIADNQHFVIGSACTIISFVYSIYTLLIYFSKKETKLKKELKIYFETLSKILLVSAICYSMYLIIGYVQSNELHTDIKHFKYVPIDDDLYGRIKEMKDFIEEEEKKGKTVYILDSVAAVYMIPKGNYNKNYDMFNRGNLGKGGEKRYNKRLRR